MTIYKFSNFAQSALEASVTTSSTSIILGSADVAKFPTLSGGDGYYLTLWDRISAPEIVLVTAAAGQVLTVTRAQDGTAAVAWSAGTVVRLALTKALFESIRASSLTTSIAAPTDGQYLKYLAGVWVNSSIAQSDVTGLVAALASINATLGSHTHTAAQIDSGTPKFTTVTSDVAFALAAAYDLNSLSDVGFYKVSGPTNGPGAGNWIIECAEYDASTAYQKGIELTNLFPKEYIRRKIGGAWSAWVALPTDTTMATAIAAGSSNNFATTTGSANALAVDYTPDATIADGTEIKVRIPTVNTSTTVTISVDSGTARAVLAYDGTLPPIGGVSGDRTLRWNLATLSYLMMGSFSGGQLTNQTTLVAKALSLAKGATVASAATMDIWTPGDGNTLHGSGTATVTSFGTAPQAGAERYIIADAAFTITNNAAILVQGAATYLCSAGDLLHVIADTTTIAKVTIFKASGLPVVSPAVPTRALLGTLTTTSGTTQSITGLNPSLYRYYECEIEGVSGAAATPTLRLSVSGDNGVNYGSTQAIGGALTVSTDVWDGYVAIYGINGIQQNNPTCQSVVVINGVGNPGGGGVPKNATGATNPVNAIRFSPSTGAFDAGVIRVYGVY